MSALALARELGSPVVTGIALKPSPGLEPGTPSLPSNARAWDARACDDTRGHETPASEREGQLRLWTDGEPGA